MMTDETTDNKPQRVRLQHDGQQPVELAAQEFAAYLRLRRDLLLQELARIEDTLGMDRTKPPRR